MILVISLYSAVSEAKNKCMASNWRYKQSTGDGRDIMSLLPPLKNLLLPTVEGQRLSTRCFSCVIDISSIK